VMLRSNLLEFLLSLIVLYVLNIINISQICLFPIVK
jgi:hypothetical protein